MGELKQDVIKCIDDHGEMLRNLSDYIHSNPEIGFQEEKAEAKLKALLEGQGFKVTNPLGEQPTAFQATLDLGSEGPHIAFMAEYDALPELGHACGHNLIATVAVAAGLALAQAVEGFKGRVSVMGTPAEEVMGQGGKIAMIEAGLFDDVDLVLTAHPGHATWIGDPFLAANEVTFSFTGQSAHAAGTPYLGINAYDAVQLTFTGLNFLRQQFRQDARVHWGDVVVPDAKNVIPQKASAAVVVRATDDAYTTELTEKVVRCIEGAAMMTGCQASHSIYYGYQALRSNKVMDRLVSGYLTELGVEIEELSPYGRPGSTDAGNVSQVVPTIHPLFKITDGSVPHTPQFCVDAATDRAFEATLTMAKALALTGARCVLEPDLLAEVKADFQAGR